MKRSDLVKRLNEFPNWEIVGTKNFDIFAVEDVEMDNRQIGSKTAKFIALILTELPDENATEDFA